ncbi:MAG: RNA-binding protein [Candidatus Methanoplasma sp.]|jgi:PUA domain protein|nr:RNA-binding protein [Candidatus Methanoplasma sp.]
MKTDEDIDTSMADIRIRKRKRMRNKEIKAISAQLEEALGVPVFTEDDPVDFAESSDFDLLFVGGDILGLVYEGVPFLTVRGIIKYRPLKRYATVDMGAVPFITNGADCMGPGIVEADPSISAGDLVWIRDIKNKVPIAVGVSERNGAELIEKMPGKAIRCIHNVGDKLWKSGE